MRFLRLQARIHARLRGVRHPHRPGGELVSGSGQTLRGLATVGTAATLALCLAACTTAVGETTDSATGNSTAVSSFPVTVKHVYGETTIPARPERVATVAWTNQEVPLALGIVPVGMSKANWDDDDDGVLPWVEDRLDALGAEMPVLFDETDGIDFEAVADTEPDVILAAYSALTWEEYDTLSKIAPVVAYPDIPWGTKVEEMITLNAAALGLHDEAAVLIEEMHDTAEAALAAHSELHGKKLLFTHVDPSDLSQIGFYTAIDPRASYLHNLGLPFPSIVKETIGSSAFDLTVSAEEVDRFVDVDVFVTYGDESIIPRLQADPLLSKIPAIAAGHIAVLPDATPLAASASPSPLSIGWGFDEYLDVLATPLASSE